MSAAVQPLPIDEGLLDVRDMTILEYADAGYSAAAIASMFQLEPAYVARIIREAEEVA
jgi:hypothetical protein